MQNRSAHTGKPLQTLQHRIVRPSAVDGHDPSPYFTALRQNVFKDDNLVLPVTAEFQSTIKTDLADIRRFGKNSIEKSQLILPLVSKLRMQS